MSWTFSALIGHADPPPGMFRMDVWEPSDPNFVARMRPVFSEPLVRMAAPAPSPKRTQVFLSSQFTNDESFSAPTMRAFL